MASIELRGKSFRIVFRFGGQKFSRSLHTKNERAATATLYRLEDNLRRVELGTLVVPDNINPAVFLLSDGKAQTQAQPTKRKTLIRTLGKLCDSYLDSIPESSIEATTRHCLTVHIGHFKRELGVRFRLEDLDVEALQEYSIGGRVGSSLGGLAMKLQ